MSRVTIGSATLTLAALLLVVVWLFTAVPAPPLYDGLAPPPQPYRYLQPPNGHRASGRPSSTTQTITVSPTKSPQLFLDTSEQPPQAELYADQNAITVPSGSSPVDVSIRPVLPPATPSDGTIEGNVYQFAAKAKDGAVVHLRKHVMVALRGAGFAGSATIEQYTGGRWARLSTGQYVGVAVYTTRAASLGDFAVVVAGKTSGPTAGTSYLSFLIIGAFIVALIVVGLLLVRMSRSRTKSEGSSA